MRDTLRPMVRDTVQSLLWNIGATQARRRSLGSLTIVTFHRVLTPVQLAEYPMPGIAVTTEEFDWFLRYFMAHYECGSLREMRARAAQGADSERPLLAITFDDGQLDNLTNAAPILASHGVNATFYPTVVGTLDGQPLWPDAAAYAMASLIKENPPKAVEFQRELGITAPDGISAAQSVEYLKDHAAAQRDVFIDRLEQQLGRSPRPEWDGMMNAQQLRQLAAAGHEIGSHSWNHPILLHCSEQELLHEIAESRQHLADLTRTQIDSFCYPNGDNNETAVRIVREAGYENAVTTAFGLNAPDQDAMRLLRFDIQSNAARLRNRRLSHARIAFRLSGLQSGV